MSSSATKMTVDAAATGLLNVKQTEDTARVLNELLQEDLEKHHVFFNDSGFHNHIPHHLLALYGTGAPPSSLKHAYATNAAYQRPAHPPSSTHVSAPAWDGRGDHYPDFLRFFQDAITRDGWRVTVLQTLFGHGTDDADKKDGDKSTNGKVDGKKRADDLVQRMFGGILHPLIQLMYGLEWAQPAIVAQALAQAAVHKNSIGWFLEEAEMRSKRCEEKGSEEWTVAGLYEAAHANEKLWMSFREEDENRLTTGVLVRAREEALELAARVHIPPNQDAVAARTAEMLEGVVGMAAASALGEGGKRGKEPRFDFFLMHLATSAPFFVTLAQAAWVPVAAKARLLECKIRYDLVQYVARSSVGYSGKMVEYPAPQESVETLLSKMHNLPHDDGHVIKLARAILVACEQSKKYTHAPWSLFRDMSADAVDAYYAALVGLVWDSTKGEGVRWVRTAGLDSAWKDVPDKV